MRKLSAGIIGLCLVLGGCASSRPATTATQTTLPSGDLGYSISCANAQSLNACYEMAGYICANGYDIATQQDAQGLTAGGARVGDMATYGASSTWQKGLLVKCKHDEGTQSVGRLREVQRIQKNDMDAQAAKKGAILVGALVVPLFVVLTLTR